MNPDEVVGEAIDSMDQLDSVRFFLRCTARDPGLDVLIEDHQREVDLIECAHAIFEPRRPKQASDLVDGEEVVQYAVITVPEQVGADAGHPYPRLDVVDHGRALLQVRVVELGEKAVAEGMDRSNAEVVDPGVLDREPALG